MTRTRHDLSEARPDRRAVLLLLITGLLMASLLLYFRTPYSVIWVTDPVPITELELVRGMRFSLIAGAGAVVLMAIGLSYVPKRPNPMWIVASMALVEGLLAGYDIRSFDFFPSRIFTLPRLLSAGACIAIALLALRGLPKMKWQRLARSRVWSRSHSWVSAMIVAVLVAGLGLA